MPFKYGNKITFENIENYFSKYFLYSGDNIYPSSTIYPCKKTDYKYIVYKYKVYQIIQQWQKVSANNYATTSELRDLGIYYYQAIPIDKWGLSNFVISYERG